MWSIRILALLALGCVSNSLHVVLYWTKEVESVSFVTQDRGKETKYENADKMVVCMDCVLAS